MCKCNFRLVEDLDLCIMWFKEYSKEFIKSCSISPDAYIQLALQLTYFRWISTITALNELKNFNEEISIIRKQNNFLGCTVVWLQLMKAQVFEDSRWVEWTWSEPRVQKPLHGSKRCAKEIQKDAGLTQTKRKASKEFSSPFTV